MSYRLAELAHRLNAELVGDPDCEISALASLPQAQPGELSFLSKAKYRPQLSQTSASAVLVSADDVGLCPVNALVCKDPYLAYAQISRLFAPEPPGEGRREPSAVISPDAELHPSVAVGAHCVIEAGVSLARGVIVGAGSVIGEGCTIGEGCRFHANVTLYHGITLGERVTVHSGTVIGSDGFGFAPHEGGWVKIHQLGGVIVGSDVEIGANTTIDRGAIEDTVIGDGVIIDNQIQIAHNVRVGEGSAIAGCVGIAGSAVIGKRCQIGGGVGILGHLEIADDVIVTATSLVTKSIKKAGIYSSGTPLEPNGEWQKNFARFKQLDEMARRIKALERELNKPKES